MPWLLSLINIISTIIIIIWGLWIWFNFATTGNTEQQNKPIEPSVVLGYDQCELMQCGNWSGAQCSSGSTRYRSTFPISASVQYYVNHLYFFILNSGPIHTSEKENKKISSFVFGKYCSATSRAAKWSNLMNNLHIALYKAGEGILC